MKNIILNVTLQFPPAAIIAGAILACLGLWILLKRLTVEKAIENINRRLEGGESLVGILPSFNHLPLNELWDPEQYKKLDTYVENSIADAASLKQCFRAIKSLIHNGKKREAVMGLFLGSMKKVLTTQDLALIYADCLIQTNQDAYKAEEALIVSIIVEEHLDKDSSERIDQFRNEVLKSISSIIGNSRDENARICLRRLKIVFENSHLPRRMDLDLTKLDF